MNARAQQTVYEVFDKTTISAGTIDAIFNNYVPQRYSAALDAQLPYEQIHRAKRLDDLDWHFRRYLANFHRSLSRVYKSVQWIKKAYPDTYEEILNGFFDDFRDSVLIGGGFFELMPHYNWARMRIRQRHGVSSTEDI